MNQWFDPYCILFCPTKSCYLEYVQDLVSLLEMAIETSLLQFFFIVCHNCKCLLRHTLMAVCFKWLLSHCASIYNRVMRPLFLILSFLIVDIIHPGTKADKFCPLWQRQENTSNGYCKMLADWLVLMARGEEIYCFQLFPFPSTQSSEMFETRTLAVWESLYSFGCSTWLLQELLDLPP